MRAVPLALLGLVLVLGLTACGGGGGAGDDMAGTPRSFNREDSDVTVLPGLNGFTATQVVTISNDDAGATQAVVELVNVAGSIASSPSSDGYRIEITLTAEGDTEQEARAALASMDVVHGDSVGGNTLYLHNEVQFGPNPAGDDLRAASVTAALPAAPSYRLRERNVAGSASSSGLHGTVAQIDTTAGAATLSGTWDAADVNTVSGAVTVTGDIADLQASSISGSLQAALACARDTQALLDTTSGGIDATVTQGVGTGFDLEGQTTSGAVTILVAGTVPEGAQSPNHAHFRSPDYAGSDPQIRVLARTTSGAIAIHD